MDDLNDIAATLYTFRRNYCQISGGQYPNAALLVGHDLRAEIYRTPHEPGSPWRALPSGLTVFGWPVWAVDRGVGEPALGLTGWQVVLIGPEVGGVTGLVLPASASKESA